jgi:hypothetical protein
LGSLYLAERLLQVQRGCVGGASFWTGEQLGQLARRGSLPQPCRIAADHRGRNSAR